MPTIKRTAEGKIITKGGLPSCSCCSTDTCCMYPSALFDFDFFDADLPEKINVNGVELTHTGFGDYTCDEDQPRLSYTPSTNVWVASIAGDPDTIYEFLPCLFGSGTAITVEDQFEACYKIYLQDLDNAPYPGFLYATVYRQSLCRWNNYADYTAPYSSSPWLVELYYRPDTQKWVADLGGTPFWMIKSPHQDTPVGEYLDSWHPTWSVNVEPC